MSKPLLITNVVFPNTRPVIASPERVDILVRDGRIAAIEKANSISMENAAVFIDGGRLLVMPGMINGHVHSWDHFLKGRLENLTTELFMAQIRPRRAVELSERQIYLRTMIGAIESLKTGATTIVDDMSLGQVFSRGQVDAAFAAYSESGTRALVGFSMIDKPVVESFPFVGDHFPGDLLAELRALPRPDGKALLDLCRELVVANHPASSRIGTIISPSAPHRCTDGFLIACRDLADELDLPAMIHCQETRLQIVTGKKLYHKSIVEHLDALGFLKPRTALVHATWLSHRDVELIARSGASVQYNPWSNLITGSGIAPIRECLDAGINVSMGSDGTGILFGVNMLNTVGAGAAVQKVRETDYRRWMTAAEAFEAATMGGARALGLANDIGSLEVGKKADFVGYSLDATSLTPLNDPVSQIVYGERGLGVDTVVVDGEIVVRAERCTKIDEIALLREAQSAHSDLLDQITHSLNDSEPFLAALARVYSMSLGCPICHDNIPALISGNNIREKGAI
jgi:guanine deaminase